MATEIKHNWILWSIAETPHPAKHMGRGGHEVTGPGTWGSWALGHWSCNHGSHGVPWGPMGSHGPGEGGLGAEGVPWVPWGPWGPMGSHGPGGC